MYELRLLADFLRVPHQKLTSVGGVFGDFPFTAADFSRVPTHCKFVALMPQWDFLDFLSSKAKQFPGFTLRMQNEAVDLVATGERVSGVVSFAIAQDGRSALSGGLDGTLQLWR